MKTDVVIIGGGPGGTTCALFLAQEGVDAVVVEREQFPRFHIGESMTGECGNIVRELGLEAEMSRHRFPVKYGVTVYGPEGKNNFWVPVMGVDEQGQLIDKSTWQVRRSDFDQLLLDTAVQRGIQVVHGQAVNVLRNGVGQVSGVRVRQRDGSLTEIAAEVVVDASGQSTFLSTLGVAGKRESGGYDRQIAVFSHIRHARRDPGAAAGNTIILYKQTDVWAWFIPIDDEITSIGIVTPTEYYRAQSESLNDFYVREVQDFHPELSARLAGSLEMVEEVRAVSNYSYEVKDFTGPGFICIGDAHRFVDPIFSFGLFFSMNEGKEAAQVIGRYLKQGADDQENPFVAYEAWSDRGMDVIEDIVDLFWQHPLSFLFCVHHRYVEQFIHIFAGRVYDDTITESYLAVQQVLAGRKLGDQ